MKLLKRFATWRKVRRLAAHRLWLRRSHVIYTKPHHSCERNKTECL